MCNNSEYVFEVIAQVSAGSTLFEKGLDACMAKESGFSNPLNEWKEEE